MCFLEQLPVERETQSGTARPEQHSPAALYRLMLAQESGEWGGIERPGKATEKLPEDEVASTWFQALQWAQEATSGV